MLCLEATTKTKPYIGRCLKTPRPFNTLSIWRRFCNTMNAPGQMTGLKLLGMFISL